MDTPNFDPDEKRKELQEGAEADKRKKQEKFNQIIDAVKNDKEITHDETEFVEVGDARFEVRCEMSGGVLDTMERFRSSDKNKHPNLRELVNAAKEQTVMVQAGDMTLTEREDIDGFFDQYYEAYGSQAIQTAVERVFKPVVDNGQKVPQSFRNE